MASSVLGKRSGNNLYSEALIMETITKSGGEVMTDWFSDEDLSDLKEGIKYKDNKYDITKVVDCDTVNLLKTMASSVLGKRSTRTDNTASDEECKDALTKLATYVVKRGGKEDNVKGLSARRKTHDNWCYYTENGRGFNNCAAVADGLQLPGPQGWGPWTKEEDAKLKAIVELNGAAEKVKWSNIAKQIPGRSGRQCKQRYFNHLDPSVKTGKWTEEEDSVIFKAQKKMGNQWSKIAKLLPGRTDKNVVNRFNSSARKKWMLLHEKELNETNEHIIIHSLVPPEPAQSETSTSVSPLLLDIKSEIVDGISISAFSDDAGLNSSSMSTSTSMSTSMHSNLDVLDPLPPSDPASCKRKRSTSSGPTTTSTPTKSNKMRKGPWTEEEDAKLLNAIVELNGAAEKVKWSNIAEQIPERNGKQCKQRYFNHLDPSVKTGKWTEEEDSVIFKAQKKMGNQWTEIAKLLPGRTDKNVVNRFNSSARKKWMLLHEKELNETNEHTIIHSLVPPEPAQSETSNTASCKRKRSTSSGSTTTSTPSTPTKSNKISRRR
ncbi:hypothetical protein TrCOL_g11265 [Triparma columacea]|uniref:Uncharacterized protein n=1 Tax=Triparma columacea TaxID=722753 RepID=A0A9W7G4X7_9STRA|nr:hypothetical protein TrCOL_g11265 [Triparma columacea]